jgi:hypothetical protein
MRNDKILMENMHMADESFMLSINGISGQIRRKSGAEKVK